jgi:hypothetical protein
LDRNGSLSSRGFPRRPSCIPALENYPRGLCRPLASSADFRPGRGRKVDLTWCPLGISGEALLFAHFVSLRARDHVENSWPRECEVKTRWPNGNARTLPVVDRTRSEFRNRKLQETRPRCRLIERGLGSQATRMITLGPRLFSCRARWRLTPLAQGMHVDSSSSQSRRFT